jgi:hypothetical protein
VSHPPISEELVASTAPQHVDTIHAEEVEQKPTPRCCGNEERLLELVLRIAATWAH